MEKEMEIPKGKDYAIRSQTPEEKKRLDTDEIPQYKVRLSLSAEQIDRLKTQAFEEYDAIIKEHQSLKLAEKMKARDAQYEGVMKGNDRINFNVDCGQSKIKEDSIVRAISEAIIDSDPMFVVSSRPESERQDGDIVARKQSEFLDYEMDENVKPEHDLTLTARDAVRKYVGISKLCWAYRRERRRREETYDPANEGLKQFMSAYPNPEGIAGYEGYIKQLSEGKKVRIVVEYWDVIRNNAEIKYVKIENFKVRNTVKDYEGLRTTHCIAEIEEYSWYELEAMQDSGEFEDVEAVANSGTSTGDKKELPAAYRTKDYFIIKFTIYFKINPEDKRESKIQCWFSEEKSGQAGKVFLGAIQYPNYGFDTEYHPFWVKLNNKGFYGDCESVIWDLRHTHLSQNIVLSLMLHGLYVRNILTPIVLEGSEIEAIFLEKRFTDGAPLPVDALDGDVNKALGFVQYPNLDVNALQMMSQILQRIGSDITSVSDYITGAESQTDPNAPASKTMALLQQAGIGIKDFLRVYIPSFNILSTNMLQLYYQMSQEGRKYQIRRKAESVTGTNPFESISRDEMGARTVVQSRATSFAFDKINEKNENMAAYQLVRQDPYAQQIPTLQYKALQTLLKSWNPRWANIAEVDLPAPEAFKKQQVVLAVQVVQAMMAKMKESATTTGVSPQMPDPMQIADMITQGQAEQYNPMLAQARMKAEAKSA